MSILRIFRGCKPQDQYSAGERRLMEMIEALDLKLSTKQEKTMALIDDTLADVTAQTTVEQSAVTLLNSLSAQLAAAGTDPVKLQQIKDGLDANTAALAAAVAANTPAAPAPGQ